MKKELILLVSFLFVLIVHAQDNKAIEYAKRVVDQQYTELASQLNKQLPLRIDEITIFNSAFYVNHTFTGNYTLELDLSDISDDEIKALLEDMRMYQRKQIPRLFEFGKFDITQKDLCELYKLIGFKYCFAYYDINGKYLGNNVFDYNDFEQKTETDLYKDIVKGNDIWDDKNAAYTNHIYAFHWFLPPLLSWHKVIGQEKHTVFRAESENGMTVFVNIKQYNEKIDSFDMWSNFDKMTELNIMAMKQAKERSGVETTLVKSEKCRFAGENAIKLIRKEQIKDDVRDDTYYGVTYQFFKDNAIWHVSFKCKENIYNFLSEDEIKGIFKGFGINAK